MIKEKLDAVYQEVILPLENFTSSSSPGTLNRTIEYFTVLSNVMIDFGRRVNEVGNELLSLHPDSRQEIQDYIHELKNKIISTYKPK